MKTKIPLEYYWHAAPTTIQIKVKSPAKSVKVAANVILNATACRAGLRVVDKLGAMYYLY